MIRKTTKAIFKSGAYQGEYDWEGGIPLSEGEKITITTASSEQVGYVMISKAVSLNDEGENQFVHIEYVFDISS